MKKLINDPFNIVTEAVEGFVLENREQVERLEGRNIVLRRGRTPGGTKILIGGGSGHEPLFLGFVGEGMADCAVAGNVFASPSADAVYEGIKACGQGDGVLLIYGNYQGDIINFDMAQELARMENIRVETVRVWDDIASAPPERKEERRGTAGDLLVIKAAGAAAAKGLPFEEVVRVAVKARDNCRSIGISLSSCVLPGTDKPIFELQDNEMYLGMGLHGEPGIEKIPFATAAETAEIMVKKIMEDDLALSAENEVAIIINGYGSTTQLELNIMIREVYACFQKRGIKVNQVISGSLCTSLEMAGVSLTVLKLDGELRELMQARAVSKGYYKE
jgi:dihydroxyacetone kinase-like protein